MKERPILFSGPMVRAILEGRKTQTRRVVREKWLDDCWWPVVSGYPPFSFMTETEKHPYRELRTIRCPYGVPGDRLWVRETWGKDPYAHLSGHVPILYKVGPPSIDPDYPVKWKPSIHMPRWASRITLEVEAVRCEQLQDISEEDALAEGTPDKYFLRNCMSTRDAFEVLWDSINADRAPWDSNPFVWAVTFRRIAS